MTETTTDETIDAARGLDAEQAADFAADGYLVIGKLLDDALVDELRREYDEEFRRGREGATSLRDLAQDDGEFKGNGGGGKEMLQIMQMCERNIHFRRLLYHEKILDIVESLIGPNIQLFHDQALYKPAHHGGAVFWHQDNAYWQCTPANLVSAWMTLDDVDRENGAMQVIPGSHLRAAEHDRSKETEALLDLGDKVDDSRAVVIDLPAGGVMVHHCQTLHYTQPNETDRQRRAFAIHFMPPGTRKRGMTEHMPVSFQQPMLRSRI